MLWGEKRGKKFNFGFEKKKKKWQYIIPPQTEIIFQAVVMERTGLSEINERVCKMEFDLDSFFKAIQYSSFFLSQPR